MAGESRTATRPLALDRLVQAPQQVGFFQALRLLECAYAEHSRFGESQHAAEDPVRLGQEPSMAFAPSSLAGFRPASAERRARLSVLLFGLFGPNGPLPLHLTEYARDRQRNSDDRAFGGFADVFHHRMIGLFYRAWANSQPAISYDRPADDRFGRYVGALFGVGQPALRGRDALPDQAKLYYAGIMGAQTRPAAGLRAMLAGYFRVPVQLQEFVGHWIDLPAPSRWRLGETPSTGRLGMTTTVGARVWDAQGKFRIAFGPLDYEDYRRLLPGSGSLARLTALVRNYIGHEFDWDVQLVLRRDAIPPLSLGGRERLGRTTWLHCAKRRKDGDELVFNPSHANARQVEESEGE